MLKLMNIFCRGLWAVGFMLFCACGGSNGNVYKGEFRCEERPEPIRLVCEPLSAEIPGAVVGYVADSFYVAYTMMDPDYRIAVFGNFQKPAGYADYTDCQRRSQHYANA